MKKFLFFAFALVASALVFTACDKNKENEPETPGDSTSTSVIKGVKFVCDYERGGHAREYVYFVDEASFEWGWEMYEDEARTIFIDNLGDYGKYVLNEEEQKMDLTFLGSFYEKADTQREYHEGQQAHKDGQWTYKFEGDTIYLTAGNGYVDKFWKK